MKMGGADRIIPRPIRKMIDFAKQSDAFLRL